MSTFLTADTHFSHALMLQPDACARPYSNIDAMDEALVAAWNAAVHPQDTVWHLGDITMSHDQGRVARVFHALHGTKHLILGNHDMDKRGRVLEHVERLPWASVAHAAEIKHDGQRIMLSHYAGYVWAAEHRGSYQAFGHSHGKLLGLPGSVNVGVDAQDYRPISVEEFVRQADYTIEHAAQRIDDICKRLKARIAGYTERHGAELFRKRQADRRAKS